MIKKMFYVFCTLYVMGWMGCIKADETRYYTDIYWFKTSTLVFEIDTSLREPVEKPVSVFRLAGLAYRTDTVAFEVLDEFTTAVDPLNYQLINPVVRFVNADTTRSEILLRINPQTLKEPQSLALKLLYDYQPENSEIRRLHDKVLITLKPVYIPPPVPEPEPEPGNPDAGTDPEDPGTDNRTNLY